MICSMDWSTIVYPTEYDIAKFCQAIKDKGGCVYTNAAAGITGCYLNYTANSGNLTFMAGTYAVLWRFGYYALPTDLELWEECLAV